MGALRRLVEHPLRLRRPALVRPRVVLRHRRVHGHALGHLLGPLALAGHPPRHGARRPRRHRDRLSHVSPARALLRPVDAGLSARHPLRDAVPGLPGSVDADAPRERAPLHGVQRAARLHPARGPAAGRRGGRLAGHRELALRPGPAGDPAERAGRRGRGHQLAPLEDALAGGVGDDGRGSRRLLRPRAAGRDAGFRVRHARVRPGGGGHAVRRRGLGLGAGDRRGHPGPARGDAAGRAGDLPARHPGRGLRHRHHRHHAALARRALLDHRRPLVPPRGAAAHPRSGAAPAPGATRPGRCCRSRGCRAPSAGSGPSAR